MLTYGHRSTLLSRWYDFEFPTPLYDPVYHECIKRLSEFDNLRATTVYFDRHGAFDGKNILQGRLFQQNGCVEFFAQ